MGECCGQVPLWRLLWDAFKADPAAIARTRRGLCLNCYSDPCIGGLGCPK